MDREINIKGITLIEILVVLSIMGILLSIGIPQYTKWKTKYDYECDIKELYSLLSDARMKSYTQKRVCGIYFGSTIFAIAQLRCDTDDDGDITDTGSEIITSLTLKKTFVSSASYVKFTDGIAKNLINIRPQNTLTGSTENCIAISVTRIRIGKWNGSTCNY